MSPWPPGRSLASARPTTSAPSAPALPSACSPDRAHFPQLARPSPPRLGMHTRAGIWPSPSTSTFRPLRAELPLLSPTRTTPVHHHHLHHHQEGTAARGSSIRLQHSSIDSRPTAPVAAAAVLPLESESSNARPRLFAPLSYTAKRCPPAPPLHCTFGFPPCLRPIAFPARLRQTKCAKPVVQSGLLTRPSFLRRRLSPLAACLRRPFQPPTSRYTRSPNRFPCHRSPSILLGVAIPVAACRAAFPLSTRFTHQRSMYARVTRSPAA